MTDCKGSCYKLSGIISGIFLTILIMRHPLLHEYHAELDDLVPHETYIHRQIPHLHKKVNDIYSVINSHVVLTEADKDKTVLDYVQDTLLRDDTVQAAEGDKWKLTPLHKTMLLLGCYGDPEEISVVLNRDFLNITGEKEKPGILYNFMLEALDKYNMQKHINGQIFSLPDHDKSMCSCLRDFATPSLLQVTDNDDAKCTPDGNQEYSYDTCTMQELIDYTIDTEYNVTDVSQRQNIILPSGAPRRNRKDPFLQRIEDYESNYKSGSVNWANENLAETRLFATTLKEFITQYCKYAQHCPKDWFDSSNTFKTSTLASTVFTEMKNWYKSMRTYNKLKTPTVASLGNDGFKHYIKKYRAALQTCSSFGIQHYSLEYAGKTKFVHWYVLGELFLLLAASVAFVWAHTAEKAEQQISNKNLKDNMAKAAGWINQLNFAAACGATVALLGLVIFL